MTLAICQTCGGFVDVKEDPDCYIEEITGYERDYICCEPCREKHIDEAGVYHKGE